MCRRLTPRFTCIRHQCCPSSALQLLRVIVGPRPGELEHDMAQRLIIVHFQAVFVSAPSRLSTPNAGWCWVVCSALMASREWSGEAPYTAPVASTTLLPVHACTRQ